jgi:hypothetical protein
MAATLYHLRSSQALTSAHRHLMTGQRQQDQQVRTGGCAATGPAQLHWMGLCSPATNMRMARERLLQLAESG